MVLVLIEAKSSLISSRLSAGVAPFLILCFGPRGPTMQD